MTTQNLTNELSDLFASSMNQYATMRDRIIARMKEIEAEKAELAAMKAKIDIVMGLPQEDIKTTAETPKAERSPVKRGPRKRTAEVTEDTTTEAVPETTGSKPRLDWDAMTTAIVDVVRTKGPIDIKSIVETIGTQIRGVRYSTVAQVLNDNKDMLKTQGERPRLYSIASVA